MTIYIKNGTIVNEGRSFKGDLVIEDDRIVDITACKMITRGQYDKIIDAAGCFVLPGIIDEHVHFREPGMERKADIESESRAAVFGGVTSYFEMPNTNPQTTNLENWLDKLRRGKEESHVNYSFFFGATNDNAGLFHQLDVHRVPGIKLFMGASTGNMLVDRIDSLRKIFSEAARLHLPVMAHCEDSVLIGHNMAMVKAMYGDDPDIKFHPVIRNEEVCYKSSLLAAQLAKESGAHLHIAHISTAKELTLLCKPQITGEAVLAHLLFCDQDYAVKGALIKCNPSVKKKSDRDELRKALDDGRIYTIGTDHAPHEKKDKEGGCIKASSGMPMIQFSLVAMLELVDEGVLTIEKLVELMAHHPADLFHVVDRGYLRKGYKADVTIVRPHKSWTVNENLIQSKCKWSPVTGHTFHWQVQQTICNGHLVYDQGCFDRDYRGEEIYFRK